MNNNDDIKVLSVIMGFFVIGLIILGNVIGKINVRPPEPSILVTDTIVFTDTVIQTDTIIKRVPTEKTTCVLDTVIINKDTPYEASLLVEQKEYQDSDYVCWVSGIDPSLDSLKIFRKDKYIYETKLISRQYYLNDKSPKLYAGVGFFRLGSTFSPHLNVTLAKQSVMLSANVGLSDRGIVYGTNFNIKIK